MTYAKFLDIFETFRYPAGESHVRLSPNANLGDLETIEAAATGFDDLGQIITADRILKRNKIYVEWFVPYFPFARHDRRIDNLDGFELGTALAMVADLRLVIADAHSEVAGQLPQIGQEAAVALYRERGVIKPDTVIVIPDAGAAKKAHDWAGTNPTIQCLKHRDQMTGKLSGFQILAEPKEVAGRECVIVDDICDGGGTFIGVANELRRFGPETLTLAVTHGLFTKGTDALLKSFNRIVTFGDRTLSEPVAVIRLPFQDLYAKGNRR